MPGFPGMIDRSGPTRSAAVCATLFASALLVVCGCAGRRVEPPAGAPGGFTIAGNRDAVEIPFELQGGTKPLIRGTMNGRPVAFLVDNGKLFDQVWFYDGEVDSIGVRYQSGTADTLRGIGGGSSTEIRQGNDVDISFGDVRFTAQPTLISPREAGFAAYFPGVNGQVSSLLFKHFVVTFDFDRNVMVLTRPERFTPRGKGQGIPMRQGANGSYCVPFSLRMAPDSEAREVMLDIDIGTIFPLYLIENKAGGIRIPAGAPKTLVGYGASGAIYGYEGIVASVGIGRHSVGNVPAEFVESAAGDSAMVEAGTFGLPLMRRFNVTFDYFHRLMYLEPNKSFDATTWAAPRR